MAQIQEIGFHATFLVPTYNLGDKTRFITTQNAYSIDNKVSKSIDVWLIQAIEGQETESMLTSLRKEQLNGEREIKKTKKDEGLSAAEKDERISFLRHYAKLMKTYLKDYHRSNMQHTPDPEFVDIAKRNLATVNCNVDKAIYLCGITHLIER